MRKYNSKCNNKLFSKTDSAHKQQTLTQGSVHDELNSVVLAKLFHELHRSSVDERILNLIARHLHAGARDLAEPPSVEVGERKFSCSEEECE